MTERGNALSDHLNIGAVIFPEMDQIDFTGPFEVLSRLPDSTFHVLGKEKRPVHVLGKGVRATTHWGSFHLLPYFGAIPVDDRVVVDGRVVSAAGVTAGLDGALRLATLLRGDTAAQRIQFNIQYAPEPPFSSGTPASAPPEVLAAEREASRALTEQRRLTARRIAAKLQVTVQD